MNNLQFIVNVLDKNASSVALVCDKIKGRIKGNTITRISMIPIIEMSTGKGSDSSTFQ